MKTALTLIAVLAALAVAAPTADAAGQPHGYRFITDTLGGNGHRKPKPKPKVHRYQFITDTLGGNGHPKQLQGYRLITDTLGGNGGAVASAPTTAGGPSFDWADAGIGAASAAGMMLTLAGASLLVLRRRGRLTL
jgi:hypothetical protein